MLTGHSNLHEIHFTNRLRLQSFFFSKNFLNNAKFKNLNIIK